MLVNLSNTKDPAVLRKNDVELYEISEDISACYMEQGRGKKTIPGAK